MCTDGQGDWITVGCSTEVGGGEVKCSCDHLTNFAYLVVNNRCLDDLCIEKLFTCPVHCRIYQSEQEKLMNPSQVVRSCLPWRLSQ